MSNYHYKDQSGCTNCLSDNMYVPLKKVNDFGCGPKCIDRFNDERSVKDKMYYDHFVLNKPWNLKNNLPRNKNL